MDCDAGAEPVRGHPLHVRHFHRVQLVLFRRVLLPCYEPHDNRAELSQVVVPPGPSLIYAGRQHRVCAGRHYLDGSRGGRGERCPDDQATSHHENVPSLADRAGPEALGSTGRKSRGHVCHPDFEAVAHSRVFDTPLRVSVLSDRGEQRMLRIPRQRLPLVRLRTRRDGAGMHSRKLAVPLRCGRVVKFGPSSEVSGVDLFLHYDAVDDRIRRYRPGERHREGVRDSPRHDRRHGVCILRRVHLVSRDSE
mmetsp:Transcript_32226/g.76576  ORF Transcript_32226/g.76576 Transcript_32226/m.76576 type:complete len:250 (-) Transcript_32226:1405-2154(-)